MASRQRQGVGRKLLSHAEQAIGAAGSAQARLEADACASTLQGGRLYRENPLSR
ncbi:GNAT family N-acetyltransferase [Mesorhizobium sp. Root102]|uniref:GNAT family N-acetyltransferase n=1 Tax=Mesorhizobium sp. Root102 TaxID=1736422 RepID=UPI001FCD71C4|nr:GNAT family N-acetyltransferase [Mesorhizobium sp. Root102]